LRAEVRGRRKLESLDKIKTGQWKMERKKKDKKYAESQL